MRKVVYKKLGAGLTKVKPIEFLFIVLFMVAYIVAFGWLLNLQG